MFCHGYISPRIKLSLFFSHARVEHRHWHHCSRCIQQRISGQHVPKGCSCSQLCWSSKYWMMMLSFIIESKRTMLSAHCSSTGFMASRWSPHAWRMELTTLTSAESHRSSFVLMMWILRGNPAKSNCALKNAFVLTVPGAHAAWVPHKGHGQRGVRNWQLRLWLHTGRPGNSLYSEPL